MSSGESPASPRRVRSSWWHRGIRWCCAHLYYSRITVEGREHLPRHPRQAVLHLGLHRNGAVDGFVYGKAVPDAVFMISTQLRRHLLARLFFSGIAVVRDKDAGERAANEQALQTCLAHLRAGGELFVLPEGTSDLGPHHLPFKSGAAWLLREYLADPTARPIRVLPLAIHYERAWAFRSRVHVVIGAPLDFASPPHRASRERLRELRARLQEALEIVGFNVTTIAQQETIEALASFASSGSGGSYFRCLKALEANLPQEIETTWNEIQHTASRHGLWRWQGVPLVSDRPVILDLTALLPMSAIVAVGIVLNLPPFLVAWWAGRRFSDGRNVIALWRLLVGLPAAAVWWSALILLIIVARAWLAGAAWLACSVLALALYLPTKQLAVALFNRLRHPALRPRLHALRASLQILFEHARV